MQATIEMFPNWTSHGLDWSSKDRSNPILVLKSSIKDLKEYPVLQSLAKSCKGVQGKGFQRLLVGLDEDRLHEVGFLKIDLGTLIEMVMALRANKADRAFAINWLKSYVPEKLPSTDKKETLTCLCGQAFSANKKGIKHRRAHMRQCAVIKEHMPFFRRVKKSLDALKGKQNGKAKKQTSKLQHSKGSKVHNKKASGQKRKSKVSRSVKGAKVRRAKRDNHS